MEGAGGDVQRTPAAWPPIPPALTFVSAHTILASGDREGHLHIVMREIGTMGGNTNIHSFRGNLGLPDAAAMPIARPRSLAVFAWLGERTRRADTAARPISEPGQH